MSSAEWPLVLKWAATGFLATLLYTMFALFVVVNSAVEGLASFSYILLYTPLALIR